PAALERVDLHLPPVVVEPFGADDVVGVRSRERLELRDGAEVARAVDRERSLAVAHAQLDGVPRLALQPHDVDRPRGDRPELLRLTDGPRSIWRLQLTLDGVGKRRERRVSLLVLHQDRPVREDVERELVAADVGRADGCDRIPLALTRHTMDARLARPTHD